MLEYLLLAFQSTLPDSTIMPPSVHMRNTAISREEHPVRTVAAAVGGSLTYVALYMLKTFVYQRFVYGYPMDAVGATMVAKLIPSLINAAVAVVAAPVFYHALRPALRSAGMWEKLRA